jgi:hypothetical protein
MSKAKWLFVACSVLLLLFVGYAENTAQRGPGKGKGKGGAGPGGGGPGGGPGRGADRFRFADLNIEDLRPEGRFEVLNLLPTAADQPRIGITDTMAYRLADYDADSNTASFVAVDLTNGQLSSREVRLGNDAPKFQGMPRMSFDGGSHVVLSQQAATVFVDINNSRARTAAGFDSSIPVVAGPPPRRRGQGGGRDRWPGSARDDASIPAQAYRVHGGANGQYALSMLQTYDRDRRLFTSSNGVLHSQAGRSVNLTWNHEDLGVPPRGRDAVFAVTGDQIIVMVTRPKEPGNSDSWLRVSFLIFDMRGALKEVQEVPGNFSSRTANNYFLSPDGRFFVAHPEDGIHMAVYERGTWERVLRTDFNDPCIGFAPEGNIGVFLANESPERAAIKAIRLTDQQELWKTTVSHERARGNGEQRPFTAVAPGAVAVASTFGIIAGRSTPNAEFLYTADAVDFEPLAIAYDEAGRQVAVLARDRMFVIDARTRTETHSVSFETALPEGVIGEFIAFDPRGRKVMACARNQGVWVFDLASGQIETTLPAVPGTWARPMPDLSGVVYSRLSSEGGDTMLQPVDGKPATRVYACQNPDVQAVCLWISARGDEFLIVERGAGPGNLFLIDNRGRKSVEYSVADEDGRIVGDNAITAFVTRRKQVVMISEASMFNRTGINCTIISPDSGRGVESTFTCVVVTDELPGRSTYGETAASPFFSQAHGGDERVARFACPAGVLEIDIGRQQFTLHAWSRSPSGLAAVNTRAREFFVAGGAGLTSYKMK